MRKPFLRVVTVAVPAALIPLLDRNPYHLDVMTLVGLYAMLAMGLGVTVGFTGLLNLGYAAFFGIGAYAYALVNLHFHIPFWPGMLFAGFCSMLFGLLIGIPSIRVRGDYLAITTLGFGEITRIALNNLDTLTGGPNGLLGIDRPKIWIPVWGEGGWTVQAWSFSVSALPYFYLVLFLSALTAFFLLRMGDSKIGRALVAIREDELAAGCMGVPVLRTKLVAFGVSSFIAGVAGAVFASKQTIVTPDSFDFVLSVLLLAMVVLGGMGNLAGAALGAVILGSLPEILRGFAAYRMLLFGSLMILVMIFRPQGLLGSSRIRRELAKPRAPGTDTDASS